MRIFRDVLRVMELKSALIIEDESKNLVALKEMLTTSCPEIKVVGEASSIQKAREQVLLLQPDIIFMDIQLADGDAFQLLQLLEEDKEKGLVEHYQVIFTTASNQHAIQAFRFSAVDYLLKPIISTELKEAVSKAVQTDQKAGFQTDQLKVLLGDILKIDPEKKICLSTSEELKIFFVKDIIRCESSHNYTTFHFVNDQPLLISKTLKDYEMILSSYGFLRVHQSHLINIKYIKALSKRDGGYLRMTDGAEVPISRRKKDELLEKLKEI